MSMPDQDQKFRYSKELVDFSRVIPHLKLGGAAKRQGWNGQNQHINLQVPDAHSKMGLPYIYISTEQKQLCPWTASQTDLLAEDWVLLAPY